jgi:transposase-like protein
MQDIAGDYGFTESRISQIITETRLKIKQMFDKDIQIPKEEVMGRRAPSEEYLRKVADTIRDSYTYFDAAARLNISTSTINRWSNLYPEIKDALHNMKDPEVFTESNATPARPSITRDTNLPDFAFKGTVTFFGQPVHIDITVTRQSVQPSQPIQPVEA